MLCFHNNWNSYNPSRKFVRYTRTRAHPYTASCTATTCVFLPCANHFSCDYAVFQPWTLAAITGVGKQRLDQCSTYVDAQSCYAIKLAWGNAASTKATSLSAGSLPCINKYWRLLTIVRLQNKHRSERHSSISGDRRFSMTWQCHPKATWAHRKFHPMEIGPWNKLAIGSCWTGCKWPRTVIR